MTILKYKVKEFFLGIYEYDTLFIDVEGKEYQIPCKKGLFDKNIIDKEIEIKRFDMPLEEIEPALYKEVILKRK
jgi:hypothetical protein